MLEAIKGSREEQGEDEELSKPTSVLLLHECYGRSQCSSS